MSRARVRSSSSVAVGEQGGPGRLGVRDEQRGFHALMDFHCFGEPGVGGVEVAEHVVELSEVERNGLVER